MRNKTSNAPRIGSWGGGSGKMIKKESTKFASSEFDGVQLTDLLTKSPRKHEILQTNGQKTFLKYKMNNDSKESSVSFNSNPYNNPKKLAKQERKIKRQSKRLGRIIKLMPDGDLKNTLVTIKNAPPRNFDEKVGKDGEKQKIFSPLALASFGCVLAMILFILMATIPGSIFPLFGLFAVFATAGALATGILGLKEISVYNLKGKGFALAGILIPALALLSLTALFIAAIASF